MLKLSEKSPLDRYPPPGTHPEWGLVVGTWGDSLLSLGCIQAVLTPPYRILYVGRESQIPEWLATQEGVEEVRSLVPATHGDYLYEIGRMPIDPARREEWLPDLLAYYECALDPATVWPCQVDFTLREEAPLFLPRNLTLPPAAYVAAAALTDGLPERTILLQPRSEASCPWALHWPHWHEAVSWLLRETDYTLLLVGHGFTSDFPTHPRLVNQIGATGSILDVFALAATLPLTLTTGNALAVWGATAGIPGMVACLNYSHSKQRHPFTQSFSQGGVRVVEHWQGMDRFLSAFHAAIGPSPVSLPLHR